MAGKAPGPPKIDFDKQKVWRQRDSYEDPRRREHAKHKLPAELADVFAGAGATDVLAELVSSMPLAEHVFAWTYCARRFNKNIMPGSELLQYGISHGFETA